MRSPVVAVAFVVMAVTGAAGPVPAQNARVYSSPVPRVLRGGDDDQSRAALGLSMASSTSARDTLGLLVASVIANSPAERAGIEEGDRLASINSVNLKLSPADVGDVDIGGAMSRRLTRELARVRPGDEVDLRVYSEGRTRIVHIRTIDSDSLYGRRRTVRNESDDRPTLGLGIGATNSRRDSLGVLVMFVDDNGPAARAGIEEGNRIAAIENVDLRVGREDSGDDFLANSKVRRLQREIARLHPGDDVELRVYANGSFRTMRLRVARASDLPHRRGAFIITGDGMNMLGPGFPLGLDGALMGANLRGAIERAMEATGRALEGVGRGLGETRIMWQDDQPDEAPRRIEQIEPIKIEPLEPSRLRVRTPSPPRGAYTSALLFDSTLPGGTATAVARRAATGDAGGNAAIDVAGLRMVSVGSELATYLGKGSERGLLVISVPQWARSVLRAGDVVLSIDGLPVRTDDGSDQVTVALPRFRDAELEILRDSVHHSVMLPARR